MRPASEIPAGLVITKVDVTAPDHVPGQTMPHYKPLKHGTE